MSKYCIAMFQKLGAKWHIMLLSLLLLIALGLIAIYPSVWIHRIWDNNPDRGALPGGTTHKFDDRFDKVIYLEQGWNPSESLWFYNTTQGSDLLPYDFFMVLEQVGKLEPFRSNENMDSYRYLPQVKTSNNPDALPVGMVLDEYRNKKYMGFTCAACHTAQINYKGTGIRIDGGPAAADMDAFMHDLEEALSETEKDSAKKKRFVEAVLKLGNYRDEKEVLADLKTFSSRMRIYNFINESPTKYGYGRLDAFGRIFNRVLQHLVTQEELESLLAKQLTKDEYNIVFPESNHKTKFYRASNRIKEMVGINKHEEREHIIERLLDQFEQLASEAEKKAKAEKSYNFSSSMEATKYYLRTDLFNRPDAPVSYPFLWDTPQHDYVQWNGLAANAGEGPIGRNTGEVIGVFATLDWSEKPHWTVSSVIGGQGFGKTHISFKSSVKSHNLILLESQLVKLYSPKWPEAIFGKNLDKEMMDRGEDIFKNRCIKCHQNIYRTSEDRRVVAKITKVSAVGTDPKMASNSVNSTGLSGILTNQYVNLGVGSILLTGRSPVAALLSKADLNVVTTPDPDKWFFQRWANWAHDLIIAYLNNDIKPSMKVGDYDDDTTVKPLSSLLSYKARSLNGIWATAPYLHNGSVPTLYDLLLPAKKEAKDPPGTEYRPETFITGSREFDPEKVGFKHSNYDGFPFDTKISGNSNEGHEYGTRDIKRPDGTVIQKALTKSERQDLLEYLKSL